MDGESVGTVDIGDSEKPRSLAVHPIKRLIFWSDAGLQAIYRARMDGAERMTLARNLEGITALAVDPQLDLLFFAHGKKLDCMDINGKNK